MSTWPDYLDCEMKY